MSRGFTDRFWVGFLGLFALGSLLVFALFFWKERILFTDMAFHTYVILQTKSLAIQNNRFGAAITQAFPLVSAHLQLPLPTLMKLYSCSFYIWYSLVFVFILFVLRVKEIALVLVMYLTLLVSYSFFWAQSEYPQGMVFLALFFAALLYFNRPETRSIIGYVLVAALLVVALFLHPLIVIPCGCCMVYLLLAKKARPGVGITLLVAAAVVYKLKSVFLPTGYESTKMEGLNNFATLFPNYLTLPSTKFFIKQLFTDYLGYLLVVLAVTIHFIKKHSYVKLAWLAGSLTAYTLLITVSNPYEQGKSTYIQNMVLPLGFIAAMPFVFEVLPALSRKVWVPVLAVLISFRLVMIFQSHPPFTQRVAYLQQMLDKSKTYPGSKFYVADEAITTSGVVGDSWALSYETLLLSSISSPDSARSIELKSIYNARTFFHDSTSAFINRFWDHSASSLPKEYFRLKEGKYQEIKL